MSYKTTNQNKNGQYILNYIEKIKEEEQTYKRMKTI